MRAVTFSDETASPFVGRGAELAALDERLRRARLVTVVGPRGIGKSRLLRRWASTRRARPGGVLLCDLREVSDLDEAFARVLAMLGVEPRVAASDRQRAIARILASRGELVLVLDGIERLLPVAALLAQRWLAAAPSLRIVAGSRTPLGLDDVEVEALLELGALDVSDAVSGDAVELAVARASAVRAAWSPSDAERAALAELARRLRGVPLAIEIAASRLDVLELDDLLARVPALEGAATIERVAQRAIDRAWLLLAPWEREVLAQASVFRGGFGLDALARVVTLGADAPSPGDVALTLTRKGLLEVHGGESLRLVMADSVRAHAAAALGPRGDEVAMRHLRVFDELAARAAGLDGLSVVPASSFVVERENLQAACLLAESMAMHDRVLRLSLALDALSLGTGLSRIDLARLDAALSAGATRDPALLGRALGVRASALHALGRLDEAKRDATTALALARDAEDERQIAAMQRAVGQSAAQLGELFDARASYEQALAIARRRGDRPTVAAILQQLGAVHQSLGEVERARIFHENARALAVEAGDDPAEARATIGLGSYWLERGDLRRARTCYERGLAIARRMRMARTERIVLGYLGIVRFDAGALGEAESLLRAASNASGEAGDVRVEAFFDGVRGAVLASRDRIVDARACFESAEEVLASNPFFAEVVAIHRGHLDLAIARRASAHGDRELADAHELFARLRLLDARDPSTRPGPLTAARPIVERSDDARIAVRILERAIAAGARED